MCALNATKIITTIYNDVFRATYGKACYVFLCGGGGKNNIRNRMRIKLEKEGFQILYPEDLFMEMLNRNKKSDLLEYESLLADNANIICIICESIGSAAELGAFIQSDKLQKKMVVCINQKYSREKSFIMEGPAKHLKKVNKDRASVIIYKDNNDDNIEKFKKDLVEAFKPLHSHFYQLNMNPSFNNLSEYIAFIPMVIYFFESISRRELHKCLKEMLVEEKSIPSNYNELFNASINYLIKVSELESQFNVKENDEVFSLSSKGYLATSNLLKQSWAPEKNKLYDKIRCDILKEQLKLNN